MARPTISVIIPSIGRDTLDAALASCEQADEVILVFDDAIQRADTKHLTFDNMRVTGTCGRGAGDVGYTARMFGQSLATSSHLAYLDDDDVFLPGTFDLMRQHALSDRPTIFRMDHPASIFWRKPEVQYGNIGTPQLLIPNIPDQLGKWEEHEHGVGGDYRFLKGCIVKMGHQPQFVDEIIAVVRPHDRPGVFNSYL